MKHILFIFSILISYSLCAQHQVNAENYGPVQQIVTDQSKGDNSSKSLVVQPVDQQLVAQQNEEIGKQIKKAGIITLGIGAPIAVAGAACLIYGFSSYSLPTDGYTTSAQEAKSNANLKYVTQEEYNKKVLAGADVAKKHENSKTAGYVLLSVGATMTLVSIPIIVAGNHIMDMSLNYGTNGIGLVLNY